MENRMLLSALVAIFIFAAVMVPISMTGQIIAEPGGEDEEPGKVCLVKWVCSDWSDCIDGVQTRKCVDQNRCGTTTSKPSTTQECEAPKEWHPVAKFADDEDETTELFQIPSAKWRIK